MRPRTEPVASSKDAQLPFSKLQALGNDFVLIDARKRSFQPEPEQIRAIANRRTGVGFDQLLILRTATNPDVHCRIDIFNSDGSQAEQCGNGMRAVALWFARHDNLSGPLDVETAAGRIHLVFKHPDAISASLGAAHFDSTSLGLAGLDALPWTLDDQGRSINVHGVSLGNPHLLIVETSRPSDERLATLAELLGRQDKLAGGSANIGLARVESRDRIQLRVFERGAGPTPACGSGAAAAAAILIRSGDVDSPLQVDQPGGSLVVNWNGGTSPVVITGPAREVFQGVIPWPTAQH